MATEERIVEVMGTTAYVIVTDGAPGLADRAVEQLEALESRWSRFRPDSEISLLNERPEVPVLVSPQTYQLIERALDGWQLTAGRFDPTLLRELRAIGYDRSFELVGAGASVASSTGASATSNGQPSPVPAAPTGRARHERPGAEQIRLDPIVGTVWLGPDVELDPGGIGKGLAADLVVEDMLTNGARGALANVGGDLRAAGAAPEGEGWVVAIDDPTDIGPTDAGPTDVGRTDVGQTAVGPTDTGADLGAVVLREGAVASTWRTKRAWTAPDGTARHHVIDPTTGLPAASGLAGVTVVTALGWHAEVLAKAAFLAGPTEGAALLAANDASGLLVTDDGTVQEAGEWARFSA